VQLPQPGERRGHVDVGRQVHHHRPDLRPQEVVGAGRAERGQPGVLPAGQEVQHRLGVGEVADLPPVGRGEPAQHRRERRRPFPAGGGRERRPRGHDGAERRGPAARVQELLGGPDDLQRVRLACRAVLAPGGDAVPAEDHADRLRVGPVHRRDVQAQLEAGTPPRHPHHPVAEALLRQRLPVGGGRERDPGVRVQVVDVGGLGQRVHRGVDRGGRAALAVQAVVERCDHLVLAVRTRVDVRQRAQPVHPQHGEPGLGQRAQVAAGPLDPQQLDRPAGHGVGRGALRGGVPAGVVRVPAVGAEPPRPGDHLGGPSGRGHHQAPQPAC
jgi:hypothetical protein